MSRPLAVSIAVGLLLVPSAALAGNYQTCIKVEVDTTDSGFPITAGPDIDLLEDQWASCNSGCNAIARGVRVKVAYGGWNQTYDSDPVTGCFNWSHAETANFTMTVYGYATNVKDTFVRIHDGDYDDTSAYPGATYSAFLDDVDPTNGGSNTYYIGDYVPRWTTFASLAFGLYRYDASNEDKEIHVAFDHRDACTSSSSSVSGMTGAITSGRHYLYIGDPDPDCTADHSSRKFVTTHELGHALLRLHTNLNGSELVSTAHNEDGTKDPDSCGTSGTGSYDMGSKEWNSMGFKEAFAHFVASRIWNDKDPSGTFRLWDGSTWRTYDLERYAFGAGTGAGGRLENECCISPPSNCATSWDSAGTIEDWLRFFWDFYNNVDATCTSQPDGLDMYDLYKQVRTNGVLTTSDYFSEMETAVTQIGLPSCLSGGRFDEYAEYNGINNE